MSESPYAAWMRLALAEARTAGGDAEIPVGAVVLAPDGTVIGRGHNLREAGHDPTAHAEMVALRQAGIALEGWRLVGCTLVVTLEPCAMCAGASVLARVERLVFGAWSPEAGAVGSLWDVVRDRRLGWRPDVVSGVLADECAQLLSGWFAERRDAVDEEAGPDG